MNLQFTWLAIETMASTDSDIIVLFLDDSTISNHYYSVFHHPNNRIFEPGEDECSRLVEPLPWPMNNPTGLTIHWIPRLGQFTLPSIPSRSGNFKKNVELFRIRLDYLGMDQYLLIPFLVGWTSIYQLFDVHQGYKVLTHCHLYRLRNLPSRAGGNCVQVKTGRDRSNRSVPRSQAFLTKRRRKKKSRRMTRPLPTANGPARKWRGWFCWKKNVVYCFKRVCGLTWTPLSQTTKPRI